MKIASIQLNSEWEDSQANYPRASDFVRQAKLDGCDLVVFPEMFATGFSMNAEKIAQPINGSTVQLLSQWALHHQINVIAGLVEDNVKSGVYQNVAIVFNREGQIVAKYIKNYPFSHAGEHLHYQAGEKTVIFDVDGIRASSFICYDLRFAELFRKVAQQVEMMIVIASWPEVRQDHWLSLLKARAIENQCFVIGVNRTGIDGNGLSYIGGSLVIDPLGKILSHTDEHQEYQVTEIDINTVKTVREKLPFLQDMKSD